MVRNQCNKIPSDGGADKSSVECEVPEGAHSARCRMQASSPRLTNLRALTLCTSAQHIGPRIALEGIAAGPLIARKARLASSPLHEQSSSHPIGRRRRDKNTTTSRDRSVLRRLRAAPKALKTCKQHHQSHLLAAADKWLALAGRAAFVPAPKRRSAAASQRFGRSRHPELGRLPAVQATT